MQDTLFYDCRGRAFAVLARDGTVLSRNVDRSGESIASTCSIVNTNFVRCVSGSVGSPFLDVVCDSVAITGGNFSFEADSQEYKAMQLQLKNGVSKIEDVTFTVSDGSLYGGLMSFVLAESQVQFYNCCFTHSAVQHADSLVFVDISGPGVVDFSAVCFDAVASSSIRTNGEATVNCPESSFESCQCFVVHSSDSEGSASDSDLDSSEPWTSGSPPQTTSSDTDPEEGGGKGNVKAGLIAGVVIVILVIIVIIIVVILLLIRRREKNTNPSEGHDQEFTEETITTISENTAAQDTGEWSQTTEDNPVFATENYDDDSPFTNAFEESGFFNDE